MPERVFVLELQALPSSVPAEVRLRRLLKTLLRSHGFRCVKAAERPAVAQNRGTAALPPKG